MTGVDQVALFRSGLGWVVRLEDVEGTVLLKYDLQPTDGHDVPLHEAIGVFARWFEQLEKEASMQPDNRLVRASQNHGAQTPSDEVATEAEIQAKGLTAPRITPEHINALMERVTYTLEYAPGTTSTFVHAFLGGTFYLASGHSACVSKDNFNAEVGFGIAKRNAEAKARDKLWELEGYALFKEQHTVREATPLTPFGIARVAHEVNRAFCAAMGDNSQPVWHEAPQWQVDSAVNGVKFHLANPDATPENSHESWMAQKEAEGWTYGEVKDAEKKTHPCFRPYAELPVEQRAKDYLFRAVIHSLK